MSSSTLSQLAERIREIETRELSSAPIPLGIPGLDDVFPERSLPGGSLVELVSPLEGTGAWTLALLLARQACGERKFLVIADGSCCFYPPAASRLGIDLRRMLVVRTEVGSQRSGVTVWGAPAFRRPYGRRKWHGQETVPQLGVESLRCAAVGAVIGRFDGLTAAEYRRLQAAAETGGGVGFLLLPATARGVPSFAAVRLLIGSLPNTWDQGAARSPWARAIRVQVVRMRRGKAGASFVLEVDHETGDVRVLAPLAAAAPVVPLA